jgi:MerR family transcriptional regulator, copper efflux regulator
MQRARPQLIRIGELAKQTQLSPDTLRHYERLGMLPCATRTPSGFRLYAADASRRVRTIQAALALGFKLREVAQLLQARAAGRPPCRAARRIAGERLEEVELELARLAQLRDVLRKVVARWDERLLETEPGAPALLLESLADVPSLQSRGGTDGSKRTLRRASYPRNRLRTRERV